MPVAGLALTLSESTPLVADAIAALEANSSVTVGKRIGRWLSVVLDTPDVKESRDLHEWVEAIEGVDYIDVVYVGFDDPSTDAEAKSGSLSRDEAEPAAIPSSR